MRNEHFGLSVKWLDGANAERLIVTKRWQPQSREWQSLRPWMRPPYREIETRIGEGLREHYQPPQDLPHRMLMLLMRLGGESEGRRQA